VGKILPTLLGYRFSDKGFHERGWYSLHYLTVNQLPATENQHNQSQINTPISLNHSRISGILLQLVFGFFNLFL
jgi:hypothetical protein